MRPDQYTYHAATDGASPKHLLAQWQRAPHLPKRNASLLNSAPSGSNPCRRDSKRSSIALDRIAQLPAELLTVCCRAQAMHR